MYRVYIFDDMEHFTDTDFAKACTLVSAPRRAKARQYVHESDRKQSVVAELLLRHALSDTYSLTFLPEIGFGPHDKPSFRQTGLPCFNLSHCQAAVVCAVGDEPLGIDVEPYSSYGEDLAREVFSQEELLSALGSPQHFAELWTKKESYLKYTGEGLTDNLPSLLSLCSEARFSTFHAPRGYACTVCSGAINHDLPTFVDKRTLLNG